MTEKKPKPIPLPAENTACAICGKPVGDEPRIRFVVRYMHNIYWRMHIDCAPSDMSAWLVEQEALPKPE